MSFPRLTRRSDLALRYHDICSRLRIELGHIIIRALAWRDATFRCLFATVRKLKSLFTLH